MTTSELKPNFASVNLQEDCCPALRSCGFYLNENILNIFLKVQSSSGNTNVKDEKTNKVI